MSQASNNNVTVLKGISAQAVDPIWQCVRSEAAAAVEKEPSMAAFLIEAILNHSSLESAVASRVGERLGAQGISPQLVRQAYEEMAQADSNWPHILRADISAVYERDPACDKFMQPLLYFKGFHAIQAQRLAHWLWNNDRHDMALYLQSCISSVFQVDIHPAVKMGRGLFMDHATAIVIGCTASIGDNVSILQGVTLGGTGKSDGDRHPKVMSGVLLGAGAQVLGNIRIGNCSRVAAGSVVLKDVPDNKTVAGVPAKIVGEAGCSEPSLSMDQIIAP